MEEDIDIHRSQRALAAEIALVKNRGVSLKFRGKRPISKRNAELILEYDKTRSLEGVTPGTRVFTMNKMLAIARLLSKDFSELSKEDIKELICSIDAHYKAWTRMKMRLTFKRFYKWLKQGDDFLLTEEYPEEVRWIKRALKKKDEPRVRRTDCWEEEEIKKLLGAATNPRNKALVAILTETGARVGEVGSLRVGDVYQDEHGFLIHLRGKTGERDDRVLYSGPLLAEWLNVHPRRTDPNAPLFPHPKTGKPLGYQAILGLFKRLAAKAGLGHKRCNPHIFRHSRATLLAEQGWPEPIIKQYLGWDRDSRMLSTYNHLSSRQANRYMLMAHGITSKETTEPKLKAQLCVTCHAENGPSARFCSRCARPLTHEAALKYNDRKNRASGILDQLVKDPEFGEVFKRMISEFLERQSRSSPAQSAT